MRKFPFLLPVFSGVSFLACDVDNPQECDGSARVIQEADSAIEEVVDGNSAFALDLFRELSPTQENFFFSPFSVSMALGMTQLGSNTNTEAEMAAVLGISEDQDVWHSSLGGLGSDIGSGLHCDYELALANRLFAQTGYPFHQDFLDGVLQAYQAPVESLDIQGDTENSRQYINEWIADITRDKIPELLKPGVLSPASVMVLVNAIYFKGNWSEQFEEQSTNQQGVFVQEDGTELITPIMWGEMEEARYAGLEDAQVLELPYAGGELAMTVILPAEGISLSDYEAQLTVEDMQEWADSLTPQPVFVSLPRFEMRSTATLNDALMSLGMVDLFVPGVADLSGMSDMPLFVSSVVHEAYVKVNEEGTEAAAATAVVVSEASVPDYPWFEATRPFLFQIRDLLTDSVLFMGRVTDPTEVPE